jgi:ABC-type nickel/cobalt efflux system permease component RcnA
MTESANQTLISKRGKIKRAIQNGLLLVLLPCTVLIILMLFLDKIETKNLSKGLMQGLVVLFWSIALGTFVSVSAYVKAIYNVFFKEPKVRNDSITKNSKTANFDYHNLIYWIMAALLIVLLFAVIINDFF